MFYNGYQSVTDVIGYTHSDGYALCIEHADFGEMQDPGNETGKVFPIFADEETDIDVICDMCFSEAMEKNLDVRSAIILLKNTHDENDEM